MSQNYAVWIQKVRLILTKKYKVSTQYAHKEKGCFVHQAQFSPWNSDPNPDGNEYTPRNKDYTQKWLHYRLKTLNSLTMTNLKPWFGYILCTVSIIEGRKRSIGGGGTVCQQCSILLPHPLQTKVTNKCQLNTKLIVSIYLYTHKVNKHNNISAVLSEVGYVCQISHIEYMGYFV